MAESKTSSSSISSPSPSMNENEGWDVHISDEEPITIKDDEKQKARVVESDQREALPVVEKKEEDPSKTATKSTIPNQRTKKKKNRRQDDASSSVRSVRQALTPYLPPPVLKAIHRMDPLLQPYTGEEGSFKLVGSLLLSYATLAILAFLSRRMLGHGKAVRDDEEEDLLKGGTAAAEYDQTVLLCGPTNSGKTRLFYQLVFDAPNVDTVTSLKANVAVFNGIRYMDWPGHLKLSSSLLQPVLLSRPRPRIVLVVDSTQPVAAAADCLHLLFQTYHDQQPPIPILVLCHKSDLPTAKNEKRIQLQLRGELERLLKAQSASAPTSSISSGKTTKSDHDGDTNNRNGSSTSSSSCWWPVGEPIDLTALPFVTLMFRSTTCEKGKGCKQLVEEFCRTGTLSSSSPT